MVRIHKRRPEERFYAKVDKESGPVPESRPDLGHCWLWMGGNSANGYGRFPVGAHRSIPAHRWSYEQIAGPVPPGLELDHLCRNRLCVNPDHLEAVTHEENLARSPLIVTMINRRKTRCPQGHEYTPENTHIQKSGGRRCRTCVRNETRLRARARRATGRR